MEKIEIKEIVLRELIALRSILEDERKDMEKMGEDGDCLDTEIETVEEVIELYRELRDKYGE